MKPRIHQFVPGQAKTYEVADDEIPEDRKKVLILDDDVDVTRLLKDFLAESGFDVTCVQTGVEGIKHVLATDFDAILCDMMMPQMPGDMFYLAVDRVKPHLCKRFLFMTGHRGNPKVEDFLKAHKGLVLYKPFELHVLLDTIRGLARKKVS